MSAARQLHDWQEWRRMAEAGPEPTDNVRTLPVRGFTQVDNAFLDDLLGAVTPAAFTCAMFLIRHTVGYHRDAVRLSYKQLGDALGLSRNTALRAVQELSDAHVIALDVDGDHSRTQVHTYTFLPRSAWTVGVTSAKSELVPTSAKIGLVEPKLAQKLTPTSAKIGHARNIETKEIDTNVSSEPAQEPASPEPEPEQPTLKPKPAAKKERALRDLSPDHQYRVDLIAAIEDLNGFKASNHGQEWQAAGKLYRRAGGPAPIEQVTACYRIEKEAPAWDARYLSLQSVCAVFEVYLRNPEGFRKGVERKRAAVNGTLNGGGGGGGGGSTGIGSTAAARPVRPEPPPMRVRAAPANSRPRQLE